MKKAYPSREKDRWEHALTRPLHGISFELLELMRADLFEFIDVLTTSPYDDKKSCDDNSRDLQRVADRLKELTPIRAKALRKALDAGRVEYAYTREHRLQELTAALPWQQLQAYWEEAAR